MLQREELDAFIDQLYKDIEKGEGLTRKAQAEGSLLEKTLQTLKDLPVLFIWLR